MSYPCLARDYAGSTFATIELKALLTSVVARAHQLWPTADLQLYIDDMSIAAKASTHTEAAGIVAQATQLVTTHLTRGVFAGSIAHQLSGHWVVDAH